MVCWFNLVVTIVTWKKFCFSAKSSSITGTSPSDCVISRTSMTGNLLGESYLSAELQSAPADGARRPRCSLSIYLSMRGCRPPLFPGFQYFGLLRLKQGHWGRSNSDDIIPKTQSRPAPLKLWQPWTTCNSFERAANYLVRLIREVGYIEWPSCWSFEYFFIWK